MIKSLLVKVTGRVQGVGFRYSALHMASSLGLKGWVRNEADGTVLLRFEGSEVAVDDFISWLKVGPASAVVKEVIINELLCDEFLEKFHVEY